MDVRSPFFQHVAATLAGILFLNPIMVAAAEATLAAANSNTQIGQAGNGVPVVNIATPNGNGLSHNKFNDYNVGQQGLILNNATAKTQSTQIGGIILGNANLRGQAAKLILNEVTGGSPSQLRGYTEVAGQQAHVVVANPNGITCNGCGFINTPRATLTTGKPIVEGGRLDRLQVDGGAISIEGQGLNATNIDQFDLITRSAKINAELQANKLNIITGANDVQLADLAVSKRTANPTDEPQLAIDSSALGGMYAGAIRLVGTEQGVGVKLAGNMAASAGDIQIDANGQLSLAQTAASGSVRIAAEDVAFNGKVYAGNEIAVQAEKSLSNQQSLAARNTIGLQAGELINQGVVEAGVNADNSRNANGDISIDSQRLRNGGTLAASRNLEVASRELDNRGGTLSGKVQAQIQTEQLDNRQGRLLSQGSLSVAAASLDNSQEGLLSGQQSVRVQSANLNNQRGEISTQGTALITGVDLDNRQGLLVGEASLQVSASGQMNNSQDGVLSSNGNLDITAASLDNSGGALVSQGALTAKIHGVLDNQQGSISSKGNTRVETDSLLNGSAGRLVTEGDLQLSAAQVANGNQGRIAAQGNLQAQVGVLDQRGGELLSQGRLSLTGQRLDNSAGALLAANQGIELQVADIDNRGGEISSRAAVSISATQLNNSSAGTVIGDAGLHLTVERLLNSALGRLVGRDGLVVRGASLDNSAGGTLSSQQQLDVVLSGALNNTAGSLTGTGLSISSGSLDNSAQGLLNSRSDLLLHTGTLNNNDGQLLSQQTLTISAGNLDNRKGVIASQQMLQLEATQVDNRSGLINSGTGLSLSATTLDSSSQGEVSAEQNLQLSVSQLIQRQGRLISAAGLSVDLQGGLLDNQSGLISAQGPLTLVNLHTLDNRGGELSSNASFALKAARIDNGDKGRIISAGTLSVDAAELRNAGEGLLSGWQGLSVIGGSLDNSAKGTLSSRQGALDIELSGALDNSAEGALASQGDLRVEAASLNNSAKGILSTEGDLELSLSGDLDNRDDGLISATGGASFQLRDLDNQTGEIAGRSLLLNARSLDNAGGRLVSDTRLQLNLLATLSNIQGAELASGAELLLRAGAIDNRGGTLASQGLLDIVASSFNNAVGGTLAARQALNIELSGALINSQDGLVYSLDDELSLHAGSIDNSAGTLQSKGDLVLTTTGALDNRQGHISSGEGNLQLQAASLDNSNGGTLHSIAGWLRLTLAGLFNNNTGTTQARSLDIHSGNLNNAAGHLSATHGDNQIVAGEFDNQGGGLFAGQELAVTASSFDNRNGQVAGATIDFGLGGALNNAAGIIESSSTLSLVSGSLLNDNGKLRALGSQGTTLVRTGTFDNRSGLLESANSNLQLDVGSLLNSNGRIQHVGSGSLQLASTLATAAGGTLATTGLLSISAQSWVNSGILQAARLLLDVGQFSQTASGQLLASESFSASGTNWHNDGLLASDGDLTLTLTGAYTGGGALSSLGDVQLTADSVSLGTTGRISGGGLTTLDSAGALTNRGKLTSAGDLRIGAASLDNYGTLGSGENLRISSASLLNEHGLIFSGEDMVLRTGSLLNNQADIYSLGSLDVASTDVGGLLSSLENRSGSIESQADMSLRAASLINRKALFGTSRTQTYGYISVTCYDCGGDHHNVDYVATERFETAVTEDSEAASIHSGGNLDIDGGDIVNRYSVISAAGDIRIDATSLENTGASTGTLERVRRYNTGRITDGSDERFRSNYINPYNAQPLPKEIPGAMSRWNLVSDIETSSATGVASAAIIQAGGSVAINAAQSLSNQSILAHQAPQAGAVQNVATGVSAASQPLQVTLHAQLPPDLLQQQVNPLTLPGFSLPQGSNGLFRLSGQQGESAQQTVVQHGVGDLTLGAASISAASFERSQDQADAQGPQALSGGQPLPTAAASQAVHRYLIETNPELTNLKSFLGSDYLLGNLGYDLDAVQQRLGDGLYEQRLIREAIVARTGQRFLAGLTSDEAMFRYLMDNAIASKSALNLSVGVGLSAAQVAALTHDIVWLEEHEVLGQKVLVPVLYLAQAEGRLAPNGALIQGRDVALLSGGELNNSGILRASQNLSATAGNISNSGLMQAGERLQLLATDSIRNAQGGIISARDVSALALTGDIINERSITQESRSGRGFSQLTSVVDNAAGIEARNSLELSAGRDIQNIGGNLQAGGSATLTAGRDLIIASAEAESGSMRKDRRHFWEKTNTTQYASEVQAGGDLVAQADGDLAVIASNVKAGGDVALASGGDTTIAAAANSDSREYRYKRSDKKVNKEDSSVRQQAAVIEAGSDLSITAGNDLTLSASKLQAGESVSLEAENDLRMLAEADEDYSYYEKFKKKKGRFGGSSSKHTIQEAQSVRQQGVEIDAGTDLLAIAGRDMTLVASELRAEGEAYLYAGKDFSLLAAENTTSQSSYSKKTKKGMLSSSGKTKFQLTSSSEAQGSLISADTVELLAKNDLRVHGSDVVSTDGTYLQAGNDIDVRGVTESTYRESFEAKKKSGLMGSGGIGITLGSSSLKGSQKSSSETTRASTIGSVQGDVDIQAGKQLSVIGSDVVAGRDIHLQGQEIVISAAENNNRSEQRQESKKSGLTLALSGSVGSALNSAYESSQAARDSEQSGDSRMAALQGVKAGLSGYQAMQAAEMGGGITAENAGQFFGISLSLGTQKSSSKQVQEQQLSQGSNVNAGRDLLLEATGSEEGGGDLRVTGSRLQAGRDIGLQAANDIQLEAAANTQKLKGSNKSSGGNVGVSLGVSDGGAGLSIFANANVGKGSEKGNGTTWSETTVDAGRQVSLDSGRDTRLLGSQVSGESIAAKVGRDLELRSLQDSDRFDAKQQNVSAGGSFTFGTMTGSGYVSVNQSKLKSRYDSVQEQTGLFAGQGGYQVDVGQRTQLDGAVIGSTAEADKNRLSTGTLGWSDIRNKAEFSSQQQSVSVSSSGNVGDQFLGNMAGGLLSGLSRGDKDSSSTRAAVSEGTIEIRDTQKQQQDVASLNRDVEHAHEALSLIFDKEKEQRRLREVQAIAEIGSQVMDVVRTEGQIKANRAGKAELEQQGIHEPGAGASDEEREAYQTALVNSKAYKDAMAPYGTGGDYQRVAQAVTAALQGLAGGSLNGAIAGAAAPYVAQTIKQVAGDNDTARVMAHAVLGAIVAQSQGNSAGAGAAGAVTGELMAGVIIKQLYGDVKPQDLTEEQKQKVSALSTLASGLAGAVVGGDAANAVAGAQGGKNAVDNNLLSNKYGVERLDEKGRALYEQLVAAGVGSIDELQEQFLACAGEGGCERDIRNKYRDQEREAGEKLLSLYRSGELSSDGFYFLVTRYSKAMLDGIAEAQSNSASAEGGFLGDIYRQSSIDWSPLGGITNPFLAAIRSSELIAEWKSQGLSDEKISELAMKDEVIGSVLSPIDVNGVTKLLDNGTSADAAIKYTVMAVFAAVIGGKSSGSGEKANPKAPIGGFGPTYRPADSKQLESILDSYYGVDKAGGNRVGNGGLADAVRYEKATKESLSQTAAGHSIKAVEMKSRIEKFIRKAENNPNNAYSKRDVEFAKELVRDLDDAIGR